MEQVTTGADGPRLLMRTSLGLRPTTAWELQTEFEIGPISSGSGLSSGKKKWEEFLIHFAGIYSSFDIVDLKTLEYVNKRFG